MPGRVGHHRFILLAAAGRQLAYVVLVVAHVTSALVGFGALGLSGVYAGTARRFERPDALEEAARYFRARAVGEWAIAAVPLLGAAAVLVEPHSKGLGQPWIGVGLGLWLVASAVAGFLARPARIALEAALVAATADGVLATAIGEADSAALRKAATRLAVAAAVCDVIFVVAAVDMVVKP